MAQTTKRNRKRSAQAGVTLIEMLVVVTIIGLFVALVGPSLFKRADEAKVTVTRSQIDNFMTALGYDPASARSHPDTRLICFCHFHLKVLLTHCGLSSLCCG